MTIKPGYAWRTALNFTLGYEGGYVNEPSDRGGETFRGISRRAWPDWGGWAKIDAIKAELQDNKYLRDALIVNRQLLEDAVVFYRANFWDPIHGDELPEKIAVATFDFAVHSGAKQAVRLLQVALGVLADGIVGPQTIKAANDQGERGLEEYLIARAKFLLDIMDKYPDQKVWASNWFRRLFRLAHLVLEGAGLTLISEGSND